MNLFLLLLTIAQNLFLIGRSSANETEIYNRTYNFTLWNYYHNPSAGEPTLAHQLMAEGKFNVTKHPQDKSIFRAWIESSRVVKEKNASQYDLYETLLWVARRPIERVTFDYRSDADLNFAFRLLNAEPSLSVKAFVGWFVQVISYVKFFEARVQRNETFGAGFIPSPFFGYCSRTIQMAKERGDLVVKVKVDPFGCEETKKFYKRPVKGDHEERIMVFGHDVENGTYFKESVHTIGFVKRDIHHQIGFRLSFQSKVVA